MLFSLCYHPPNTWQTFLEHMKPLTLDWLMGAMKTGVLNIPTPVRMTPCPPRLQLYSLPEQILPPKNWSLIGYNSLLHDTRIKSERGVPKIQEIVLVMIGTAIFQFWPKGAEKMEIKDFNLSSNWEWGWEMGNGNGNREYPYSQSQEMSGRHWIGAFRSLQTRGASLSVGCCKITRWTATITTWRSLTWSRRSLSTTHYF